MGELHEQSTENAVFCDRGEWWCEIVMTDYSTPQRSSKTHRQRTRTKHPLSSELADSMRQKATPPGYEDAKEPLSYSRPPSRIVRDEKSSNACLPLALLADWLDPILSSYLDPCWGFSLLGGRGRPALHFCSLTTSPLSGLRCLHSVLTTVFVWKPARSACMVGCIALSHPSLSSSEQLFHPSSYASRISPRPL